MRRSADAKHYTLANLFAISRYIQQEDRKTTAGGLWDDDWTIMHEEVPLIFRDVADLAPAERQRYFERHGVAADLRAEVESLLAFDSPDAQLIDLIGSAAEEVLETREPRAEGLSCGPYRLGRLLGRGGAGEVFLAERADGRIEQRVAVKLLRERAPRRFLRERFLQERQILAGFQHPGIARLIDAGETTEGRPYLVMDYIDGAPIDEYCRTLDLPGKLRLFLQVCEAVAYAHRSLIIHRDIKPSNILVTADGSPKLLDFGIAKILDAAADQTRTQERLLTPDYASPEQVRGAAHSTATDIYSLGAVLYRLLTGQSPHAFTAPTTPEAIDAAICTTDPPRASRLNRELPADLDFVVLKALRKEPEERYSSVDAMADDIRAFLEFRPIRARSGNAWYRARRFVRRRWIPVSALALSLACLLAGIYTAERGRALAQRRFSQLRQLANKVLKFDSELRGLPGSTRARQHIVSAGMEYLDGLAAETRSDPALALEVAAGYLQLGQVQGVPTVSNLGEFAHAEASLGKAEKAVEEVLHVSPRNPDALILRSEIVMDLMILADSQHSDAEAERWTRECVATLDRIEKAAHPSAQQLSDITSFYLNSAQSFMNRHQFEEAALYARKAVAMARSGSDNRSVAVGQSLVANILRQSGDLEGALAAITESRAVAEAFPFRDEKDRAMQLYTITWRQGQILGSDEGVSLGRPNDALEPLRRAFDLMSQLAAKDPDDATSRDRMASAALQLGDVLRGRDPREALAVFDAAIGRQRELKNNVRARRAEARLLARSSYALRDLHREGEAGERIGRAMELLRATGDYPAKTVDPGSVAEIVVRARGNHEAAEGRVEQGIAAYRDLLDQEMASGAHPDRDLAQAADISLAYLGLERLYGAAGRSREAAELKDRRVQMWRGWQQKLPGNPFVERQLKLAE